MLIGAPEGVELVVVFPPPVAFVVGVVALAAVAFPEGAGVTAAG